ncbi:MAG TPA: transporter [Phycisphaerales bacterium]|nr:transporter [Phycisphaerales bacterium]
MLTLTVACAACMAAQGVADDPRRLITDRPDFTESPQAVPHGRTQVEGGYTVSREADDEAHTLPELLVRVGLAPRWELRLSPPNAERTGGDGGEWGVTDTAVGFKYEIVRDDDAPCLFSVIGQSSLPTGDDGFASEDPEPEVKLLWSTQLADDIALSGNLNGAWRWSEDGSYFEPAVSVSASFGVTDEVGLYAEYFAFLGSDDRATEAHYLNGGATYQLSPTLQVDVRIGAGINAEADDLFAGVGFGILF